MRRRDRQKNSAGSAVIELAVVAPFFVYVCLMVFDVGSLIRIHFVMMQAAREAARIGAGVEFLEPGRYEYLANMAGWVCNGPGTPAAPGPACSAARQQTFLTAARDAIVEQLSTLDVKIQTAKIVSELQMVDGGIVTVEISVNYGGILFPFRGQRIVVRAAGPYL